MTTPADGGLPPLPEPIDPGIHNHWFTDFQMQAYARAAILQERERCAAQQPRLWILEYGAVDLPFGHPARITDFEVFSNEADANAERDACKFNARVFSVEFPEPVAAAIRMVTP